VINSEYIVTCGLDRYVRVFSRDTRATQWEIYLKQKLNQVLVAELIKNKEDDDE
jgi:hypothetical protein